MLGLVLLPAIALFGLAGLLDGGDDDTDTQDTNPDVIDPVVDPQIIAASGTSEGDLLNGTGAKDDLDGLEGDDTLNGFGNDDTLQGGPGADSISGGGGDNILLGDDGNDTLNGGCLLYTSPSPRD